MQPQYIPELITRAKTIFGNHLERFVEVTLGGGTKEIPARTAIRLYTAAIAVNFTDWMGKTFPWVCSNEAASALQENMQCEQEDDHVGMLIAFAGSVHCLPEECDYAIVAKDVSRIRDRMRNTDTAGLCGLVLMTILENLSELFIPVLERIAINIGTPDLTYTKAHGAADIAHSAAFTAALECEFATGKYQGADHLIADTTELTLNLLRTIFWIRA